MLTESTLPLLGMPTATYALAELLATRITQDALPVPLENTLGAAAICLVCPAILANTVLLVLQLAPFAFRENLQ